MPLYRMPTPAETHVVGNSADELATQELLLK